MKSGGPPSATNRIFIGVDPGHASGGACVLAGNTVWWSKAPTVDSTIHFQHALQEYITETERYGFGTWGTLSVAIERVSGRHSDGGSRAFNFGMGYGMLLQSFKERFEDIRLYTPAQWQKHFSLYGLKRDGVKLNTTEKKNRHKEVAKDLLSKAKYYDITDTDIKKLPHWKTDCYLIAHYLRDMYTC